MEDDGDEEKHSGKITEIIRSNILIFGLLAVGFVLLAIGLIQMRGQNETEIKFEEGTEVSSNSEIKVDIDGAVQNPGLYSLKNDARLQDALVAAGGLTANADRKIINLAQKLSDGQKIYIATEGEVVPVLGSNTTSGSSISNGMVSINSAAQSELEALPGIGPVRAEAIIGARPYNALEELRSKGVLGEKTFENIRGLISL